MKLPILFKHEKSKNIGVISSSALPRNFTNSKVKLENVFQICRRQRRGAAVVEFAVVAPIFFILVFGMIEYGRILMVEQVLTNASREGARVGVLDPPAGQNSLPLVTTAVSNYLTAANITGATTTAYISADSGATWTQADPSTAAYGQMVKVKVSVPFTKISWLPHSFFGNDSKTLQASTVMRRETVQ
jgi:Flp pilus assembly protein TadG